DPKDVEERLAVMERVPLILVNGQMEGAECHRISTNEEDGIRKIESHLNEQGHEHISLIGAAEGISTTDVKVKALQEEIEKQALEFRGERQIYSGYDIDDGRQAMRELLQKDSKPTAIIGINDMFIYGALKECREQ